VGACAPVPIMVPRFTARFVGSSVADWFSASRVFPLGFGERTPWYTAWRIHPQHQHPNTYIRNVMFQLCVHNSIMLNAHN